MIKTVFAIYDRPSSLYDAPMVFDDEQLGIAGLRRNIRDMYLKGDVTLDALRDREINVIGFYDSVTGEFENVKDGYRQNMSSFVQDLVVPNNEV